MELGQPIELRKTQTYSMYVDPLSMMSIEIYIDTDIHYRSPRFIILQEIE